ncbi:MAG: enoyl-CoA hydratase/isomerase family protein [Halobacteriota archaeon]|uniref:enoyl-CoA hydratase/isomerase family protein n=1 Tax=Natronomonas sp. TaxID=2184060 RepID=UPI003974E5BF
MAYETLECEREDGVGTITFDRPDAYNSINTRMGEELPAVAHELASDDAVRAIAVTSNGPVFNTGADLTELSADGTDEAHIRSLAAGLHEFVSQLVRAPKPVAIGVNGVAAGGGLGPSICGDIVLAAESARFEFAYPRIGLSGDGGSTYLLPRLVGLRRAQELAFRDEPIGAEEAADIGLVTDVVPDDELDARLSEEASRLASGPTKGYAATKRLLAESFDNPLEAQLANEGETIAELTNTTDFARGHAAFGGDEPPEFVGE